MKQILILLVVLLLTACTQQVELQLAPKVKVHVSQDSDVVLELSEEAPAYQALNQWLADHKDDWMTTNGRYPGGVYVQSGETGIQVTNQFVILYSRKNGKLEANYIQEKTRATLAVVTALGKE